MTFVPVLLCAIAVVGFLLFQTIVLAIDRGALQKAHAAQQQTVDNATKLRGSLDALAADTQRLADAGNPNAGLLVAELRKRGITINPNPPAAAASR
jgi:Tfp pilus assembly protein PilN